MSYYMYECIQDYSLLTNATEMFNLARDSAIFLPTPPYPISTVPGLLLPMIMLFFGSFEVVFSDDAITSNMAAPNTMTDGCST